MKMVMCKFVQNEVAHQRLGVGSKKSVQQGRLACALARRSAPARRREAAFSLRSHFGEGGPAKAGNAAGGFFQQTHKRSLGKSRQHPEYDIFNNALWNRQILHASSYLLIH
jgi:hypothetical protein